jgi:hypothetical protein
MSIVHKCKIHCHTIDPLKLDVMGMDDDKGKWMSFAFHMGIVVACKLSSDEEDLLAYGCTTVFTDQGDTYIIDTPYREFEEKFIRHNDTDDSDEITFREANL